MWLAISLNALGSREETTMTLDYQQLIYAVWIIEYNALFFAASSRQQVPSILVLINISKLWLTQKLHTVILCTIMFPDCLEWMTLYGQFGSKLNLEYANKNLPCSGNVKTGVITAKLHHSTVVNEILVFVEDKPGKKNMGRSGPSTEVSNSTTWTFNLQLET